jgi:hypothetical protein
VNSSIYSADRATHVRIVIAALAASIGLTIFALAVHVTQDDTYASTVRVHPSQNVELSAPAALRAHRS